MSKIQETKREKQPVKPKKRTARLPKQPLKNYYYADMLEVGVDEAGRGPMFGRVYVGAVILPNDDDFDYSMIRDSKKMSEKKRLESYNYIINNAIDWTSFWVSAEQIDEMNIYKATHYAMHKALDKLIVRPENILVDGNKFYPYRYKNDIVPHICIIGGDNKYTSIAAASIIAKVERDKYILNLCKEYPELDEYYDLKKNKGYGTKNHINGIKKYGITEWHRKSFGICRNYQ